MEDLEISKDINKKNNKKIIFSIGISFLIISLVVFICFMLFIPNVKLLGDKIITIRLNEEYKDLGVIAKYGRKDISSEVIIDNNVDSSKVGTYEIEYKVKKGIFNITKIRKVKVIDDISPEIVLTGDSEITICPGKKFDELGFTVTDNYDGDLTSKVVIVEEEDKITYTVEDSSGNTSTMVRKFIREDDAKPNIKLKGNNVIYVDKGGIYNEPGFTASDNCDGDITSEVLVEGIVDTSSTGTKEIKYTVKDKGGNTTTITRKVYVKSPNVSAPSGIYKNSMIYLTFDDGPSNITGAILDLLKEKDVKATFFVINASDSLNYLIEREHKEGHTVALHSYTHRYDLIYKSVDDYFSDLNKISNKVKKITGTTAKIIRFPGGGSNTISATYSKGIMKVLTNEVIARGYHYFDWNLDCGDAGSAKTSQDVYNNVVKYLSHNQTNVVLMHDFANNHKTLQALGAIIDYGKANGYTFAAIDMDTPLVRHRVNN